MPSYWYSQQLNIEKEDDDEETKALKAFNKRICADKKPYFMIYRYPDLMKEYKTYMKTERSVCLMNWGMKLEDLLSSTNRTPEQDEFVEWYYKKMPVGTNPCITNKICWKIEEEFDGFYAVCTTLEDDISEIIKINKRRWEIEESFRILKTYFKARPVYLKRDDRIKAHFTTCFLSLLIYRILEHKLSEKYSTNEIIKNLQDMNSLKINGIGYKQIYSKSEITTDLNDKFKLNIDQNFISSQNMKKILKESKN